MREITLNPCLKMGQSVMICGITQNPWQAPVVLIGGSRILIAVLWNCHASRLSGVRR